MKLNLIFKLGTLFIFLSMFTSFGCGRKAVPVSNGLSVYIPELTNVAEKTAIEDALSNLEKVNGAPLVRMLDSKKASLILSKIKPLSITKTQERQLEKDRAEGFFIKSDSGKTVIFGYSEKALANGLFYYLDKIGFKWYLPGEIWTIRPNSIDQNLQINEVITPDFKLRDFFGSGGFQVNHVIDPQNQRKKVWNQWKARNRFGGSQKTWGHQWQAFIQRNKKTILAHPEYLAEVKGKRVKIKNSAKLCVSNKALQKLFVEDRIKQYEANRKKFGDEDPKGQGVGVEPSDGYGHCTCGPCIAMGSISDRVYYLANETAREISKKYPKAKVGLLAYASHADTPTFDLHPNVDVTIIPAGFHDVAPGPIFIKKWKDKLKKPMNLYDYWSIPIWKLDLPGFDLYGVDNRMRFWFESGVNGASIESSYSKGSIGLALYQLSKIGWDVNKTSESIMSEFLKDCFPNSAAPMESIFRRWSDGFDFEIDQPYCLKDIEEASALAKGELEIERVEEWKKYIHFVGLMAEFKALKKKSPERIKKANEVFEFMWSIYDTYMVHSTFTQFSVTHQHEKNQDLQVNWTLNKKMMNPRVWSKIKSPSSKTLDNLIKQDISSHPILFAEKQYAKKETIQPRTSGKLKKREIGEPVKVNVRLSHNYSIYLDKNESFSSSFKLKNYKPGKSYVRAMIVKGNDPTPVLYKELTPESENFTFSPSSAGYYQLTLLVKKCVVEFNFRPNDPICFNAFPKGVTDYRFLYVPVPNGVENVVFTCPKKVNMTTLSGKALKTSELGENKFEVSLKGLGNVEGLKFQEPGQVIRFLNIPDMFFMHPNNLFTQEINFAN